MASTPANLRKLVTQLEDPALGTCKLKLDQIPPWKVNLAPGNPVLLGPVEMPTHEASEAAVARPFLQLHLLHN